MSCSCGESTQRGQSLSGTWRLSLIQGTLVTERPIALPQLRFRMEPLGLGHSLLPNIGKSSPVAMLRT